MVPAVTFSTVKPQYPALAGFHKCSQAKFIFLSFKTIGWSRCDSPDMCCAKPALVLQNCDVCPSCPSPWYLSGRLEADTQPSLILRLSNTALKCLLASQPRRSLQVSLATWIRNVSSPFVYMHQSTDFQLKKSLTSDKLTQFMPAESSSTAVWGAFNLNWLLVI